MAYNFQLGHFFYFGLLITISACGGSSSNNSNNSTVPGPTVADQILINEVMANPSALIDSVGEWFELENNSIELNLRDCVVSDKATNNFIISTDFVIGPGEYRTFAVSATPGFVPDFNYGGSGLTLNNSIESITLTCNGVTIVTFTWNSTVAGQSISISSDRSKICNDNFNDYNTDFGTPGSSNILCP